MTWWNNYLLNCLTKIDWSDPVKLLYSKVKSQVNFFFYIPMQRHFVAKNGYLPWALKFRNKRWYSLIKETPTHKEKRTIQSVFCYLNFSVFRSVSGLSWIREEQKKVLFSQCNSFHKVATIQKKIRRYKKSFVTNFPIFDQFEVSVSRNERVFLLPTSLSFQMVWNVATNFLGF